MLLQCYVGGDGVAHKVVKGYVGVNGVAKKIYEPELHSKGLIARNSVTSLSEAKYCSGATTVGNYALFGGGYGGAYSSIVDVYDTNLIHSQAESLSSSEDKEATAVGNYALFGGQKVEVYDNNLVHSVMSTVAGNISSTTVGNYALLSHTLTVYVYDINLVYSTTSLSVKRQQMAATTVGNYALFGGGWYRNSAGTTTYDVSTVDAFNNELILSNPSSLSIARRDLSATTVENYALFAGGYNNTITNCYSTVDVYTNELVRSTSLSLNEAKIRLSAASVENYALFAGGEKVSSSSDVRYNTVDVYDNNLAHSTGTPLTDSKNYIGATTVGNYALFAGGQLSSGYSSIVDAYELVKLYF